MNLFYPSCLISSSYSLSLGNSTNCDHRTDSLSTQPFFSISHFVYTLLYVDAPIPLSQLLFSFLLNSSGFSSYTILRTLYTPLIKTWVYDFHGYGAACICKNRTGLLNTLGITG